MARWVTEHKRATRDNEELKTIVIFEPEVKKQQIKRMDRYTKKLSTLIFDKHSNRYEYKKA